MRHLNKIMPYLYPSLTNNMDNGDYYLQNDGNGDYLVWTNDHTSKPTDQELADAKEEGLNDGWWKLLRRERDKLLVASDWSQGTDVPSDIKTPWATYRNDLRNLPTTTSKPSFETLNSQEDSEWLANFVMPTKPT